MVEWDGDRYVGVSGLQRMVAETSIANIDLRGDERLLDVGCGDGFVTMLLADRLPSGSVVGVDASHLMIDTALKRLTPGGLRVQFHVDDVLDLPFDRDFDIAVSFNALHWVLDQVSALRGIARSLDDGGRTVVQLVGASDRPSIEDIATVLTTEPRWHDSFLGFEAPYVHPSPDSLHEDSTFAGLAVDRIESDDLEWTFDSTADLERWFAVGAVAWTQHVPADLIDVFVHDVVDRYQQTVGAPATLHFNQTRLYAHLGPHPT